MDFPKLEDLKVGDTLVSAIQCDCLESHREYAVQEDHAVQQGSGLFIDCKMGQHFLDGHLDGGRVSGFYLKGSVQ